LSVAAVSYLPGSVGQVIDDYKVCNIKNKHFIGFLRLKYSSQLNYRRALDIIKRKAGYYQMIDVTQEGIRGFRNELIKEDCATSQIDQCLMVSSVLWTFAAEFCDLPLGANSTTGIMRVHGEHKAHKRWPMQVIEAFYAKANRVMRLALYLLLYTGQREIDVIAMKWTDVQRRGDVDMIFVKQQKTDTKVWIPIHPKLAALLAKTPRINDYILNTNRREPFASTSSISNTIKSTLRQCGVDNWRDYSGHGLRASAACELLEAGCNESLVAAITGHKDLSVLRRYLAEANQEKLALKANGKLIAL
jgi:integrase